MRVVSIFLHCMSIFPQMSNCSFNTLDTRLLFCLVNFLVWELLAELAPVLFFSWEDVVSLQTCLVWLYSRQLIKAAQANLRVRPPFPSLLSFPGDWLPLASSKGIIRCLMTRWGPEEGQFPSLGLLMCRQTVQYNWPLVCRWKEATNQNNYSLDSATA